jgi:hypothetical protein
MRRPKFLSELRVVLWPRVFVTHQNRDRGAQCFALKDTGENLAPVFFFPLGCNLALARPTAIQFTLDLGLGQFDVRRAPVDHNANAAAVRFAKSGDAKELAESVAHCVPILI